MKKTHLLFILTCIISMPKFADADSIKFKHDTTGIKDLFSILSIDFVDYTNENGQEAEFNALEKRIKSIKQKPIAISISNANKDPVEAILDLIKQLKNFKKISRIIFKNFLENEQKYKNFIREYIQPNFPMVIELSTITDENLVFYYSCL